MQQISVKDTRQEKSGVGPDYDPTSQEKDAFTETVTAFEQVENRVPADTIHIGGNPVTWYPQSGSQTDFLQCPIFECLLHGNRGGGKSDALLWAFAQHVNRGYKEAWRGVIFRQTYPQLGEIQVKSEKWFRQVFPKAQFNRTKMYWEWPTGEQLLFRHVMHPSDYFSYHGFEFPFIGFEELTTWPDSECYLQSFTLCRTSKKGVPLMIRSTTNPYGAGYGWVKERFGLHGKWWQTVVIPYPKNKDGQLEQPRCAIYSNLDENKKLLDAVPNYRQIVTSGITNDAMAAAWLDGSWEIIAGGMFGDVWDTKHNLVPRFIPPETWKMYRSFDWGSGKPFAVVWYAESDGSDLDMPGKGWISTVRGDLYVFAEWYGWNGQPNKGCHMLAVDVAKGVIERELLWGIHGHVLRGPADSSIYDMENGVSIGLDMEKKVRVNGRIYTGVSWERADKRPGSRKAGWELMRTMIKAAHPNNGLPRETPGLFVMDHCKHVIRTVPVLPRDEKDLEDVDTDAEDHCGDALRYAVRERRGNAGSGTAKVRGMF